MTKLTNFITPVTADGEYEFPVQIPGRAQLMSISGTFGSGTVKPGYSDPDGNFVAYKDDSGTDYSTTVARGWRVLLPSPGIPAIKVTGSTSPSLTLTLTPTA